MTLRHIEIFLAVCQECSVSKAAQRLHISQPTVSVAIREVEEHYSGKLFDRISNRLYITQFGEQIYDRAMRVMNLYSDLLNAEREGVVLRVGTGTAIGKLFLPRVIKTFQQDNPDVKVRVCVGEATRMYQKMLENSLDLVIAETVDNFPGLSFHTIQKFPVVAVCSTDNPLSRKKTVTAEDLARENLLLREPGSNTRAVVDAFFYSHNLQISPMWESYSVQSQINAAREGLGVSFMSLDQVLAADDEKLVILNIPDFHAVRFVNVSYLKDKIFSPVMRLFLEHYSRTTIEWFNDSVQRYNERHPDAPLAPEFEPQAEDATEAATAFDAQCGAEAAGGDDWQ